MSIGHAFYSPLAADVGGAFNWNFFAAGRVLAGFETVTPIETVTGLWQLAREPEATLESVVASIPTRGPDAVESFAVVIIGERITIVTRGTGSVDIVTASGTRRIDSRQMQPWYLAEFDGVSSLSLGSLERPVGVVAAQTSSDLPVHSGLVRAPWLAWAESAPTPAQAPEHGVDEVDGPTPMDSRIPAHQPSQPITGSIPVQSLAAAPGPYRSAITSPIPVIPAATATGDLPPLPSAPAVPRQPDEFLAAGADIDDTVRGGGRWSLLADPAEHGSTGADLDLDIEDTIVTDRQKHRADVSSVTAWSLGRLDLDPRFAPGAGGARGHYCFRIGNGQVYRLDTPVYIGRKPSSPRIVTGTIPRLLKVASPSMEVSGTHLELRQEGMNVVVTDMRSTNGTFVSQPGAAHVKLRQGESLVVTPGTLVDIGDGNVVEILPIR